MSNSIYPFLNHMISDLLNDINGPLNYIYQQLFLGARTGNVQFEHPDITGYTYMFIQPPHLSGYGFDDNYKGNLGEHSKYMAFAAIDFTPPMSQLVAAELPTRTGALPFATEFSSSGQMSMSYVDNQDQDVFSFHRIWINYVHESLRGIRSTGEPMHPDPKYFNPTAPEFGQIDYATAAWVVRTRQVSEFDIVYIGKAVGIFPLMIPDKEIIGRRDTNEITILPYSYTCALYRQIAIPNLEKFGKGVADVNQDLIQDFNESVLSAYQTNSFLNK